MLKTLWFSFEFNNYHYPGGNSYQQGYILDDDGNLNQKINGHFL